MRIALFVEGPSDKDTLSILARKVVPNAAFVTRVLPRGDLLNPKKVSAYIQQDVQKQYVNVRKVLLCVDSECTPEDELLKIIRPAEKELKRLVKGTRVFYCPVIHATEAWLASDFSALGNYLGSKNLKLSVARIVINACKPKQALEDLFERHEHNFVNTIDNLRLAQGVDHRRVISVSPSFALFAKLVSSS